MNRLHSELGFLQAYIHTYIQANKYMVNKHTEGKSKKRKRKCMDSETSTVQALVHMREWRNGGRGGLWIVIGG